MLGPPVIYLLSKNGLHSIRLCSFVRAQETATVTLISPGRLYKPPYGCLFSHISLLFDLYHAQEPSLPCPLRCAFTPCLRSSHTLRSCPRIVVAPRPRDYSACLLSSLRLRVGRPTPSGRRANTPHGRSKAGSGPCAPQSTGCSRRPWRRALSCLARPAACAAAASRRCRQVS
jgi:hypothetical protein